ncbi:hypothetical protein V6N13_087443 [Hibiscus sabdariffa]
MDELSCIPTILIQWHCYRQSPPSMSGWHSLVRSIATVLLLSPALEGDDADADADVWMSCQSIAFASSTQLSQPKSPSRSGRLKILSCS